VSELTADLSPSDLLQPLLSGKLHDGGLSATRHHRAIEEAIGRRSVEMASWWGMKLRG